MSQAQTLRSPLPPSRRVTYAEFLDGDWGTAHVEWVNGEVVMMAPVTGEHDDICIFLLSVLNPFVQAHRLGVVRKEPFQMKTGSDLPGRSPDVMFVATDRLSLLRKTFLDGPADLAVEVVSTASITVDRVDKFDEYARGGVREYWLIDPLRKQADFYRRGDDGLFRPIPPVDGVVHSTVLPGLWLKVDWLWDRPGVISVLKHWKLV
jgi:Uma2 family endonuclease